MWIFRIFSFDDSNCGFLWVILGFLIRWNSSNDFKCFFVLGLFILLMRYGYVDKVKYLIEKNLG